MNKKILSVMFGLMLLGSLGCVFAQEVYDIPVVNGEVVEANIGLSDVNISTEVGSIVSIISNYYERFLEFAGVKIFQDITDDFIGDWTALLVPAGSELNAEAITDLGLYETSVVDAEINGVTGTFVTNTMESMINEAEDTQGIIIAQTDNVTLSNDDVVTGAEVSALTTYGPCNGECAPMAKLVEVYGTEAVEDALYELSTIAGHRVTKFRFGASIAYVVDLNQDGLWEFIDEKTEGFLTDSVGGTTALIIPEGTYDLYGIIPSM